MDIWQLPRQLLLLVRSRSEAGFSVSQALEEEHAIPSAHPSILSLFHPTSHPPSSILPLISLSTCSIQMNVEHRETQVHTARMLKPRDRQMQKELRAARVYTSPLPFRNRREGASVCLRVQGGLRELDEK